MKFKFLAVLFVLFFAVPALADKDSYCSPIALQLNPTEAQGTNDFVNLIDTSFGTTLSNEDWFVAPVDIQAWNLYVENASAPGAGDIWKIVLEDDDADTILTCSISGASATTCSNLSDAPTIRRGSKLVVRVDSSTGASDPATSSEMLISFCLGKK